MRDSRKELVTARELAPGKKGPVSVFLAKCAMKLFRLDRANKVYSDTYEAQDYTGELLRATSISYHIDPEDRASIPTKGPAIVICNHPTGAMDGIVLIDILSKIRPDVKFMGNFLLDRIEPLRRYIISVDPFDSKSRSKNLRGIKESLSHLESGGLLAIFPAGEVATWQHGFRDIKDKEWDRSVLKFIRRADVPVIPLFIEARNSTLFRLAGKITPLLRTALLPRELFNKKGSPVRVIAGSAISPYKLRDLDDRQYGNYLRASVDYLKGSRDQRATACSPDAGQDIYRGIAPRPDVALMKAELAAAGAQYVLFEYGEMTMYCIPTPLIPSIIQEIGRLREMTFRQIGEGTMKDVDIDSYDEYYRQMFLWDNSKEGIVGAYRIGFGDEIMKSYGIKGFYTDSLFRYSEEMGPVLKNTIELGRSFIVKEYQRRPASLMLLWKGIVYVLLKNEQFRNMMGPVTISGEFRDSSKMIIAAWLRENHYNDKLAALVRPVTGMKGIRSGIDLSLIRGIDSVDLINRLVNDIEQEQRTVPILVKKYLGLSSTVLGFNVDHEFCDALDALMLLDMKHVPDNTIQMLSKEVTDIDVVARFRGYHKDD